MPPNRRYKLPEERAVLARHLSVTVSNRRQGVPAEGQIADRPLTHDEHRCVYATRCPHVMRICNEQRPPDFLIEEGRTTAACYLYQDMPVKRQAEEPRA